MEPLFPERYQKSVKITGYILLLATVVIFVFLFIRFGWKALLFIPLAALSMLLGLAFILYRLPKEPESKPEDDNHPDKDDENNLNKN